MACIPRVSNPGEMDKVELRACLKSGLHGKMLALWRPEVWRAQARATLSYRSHRGGMDSLGVAHSRRQTRWPSAHDRHARGGQCHPGQPAERLPMAEAPDRVSAPPNRLPLLPDVAMPRRLGTDARHPTGRSARGVGSHAWTQCGDPR